MDTDRIRRQNDGIFADRFDELRTEHRKLIDEAENLATRAGGTMNPGQQNRYNNLMSAVRRVSDELADLARERDQRLDTVMQIAEAATHPSRLEPSVGPLPGEWQSMRRTGDPWTSDARHRFGGADATRDMAFAALERSTAPDRAKAIVEQLVEDPASGTVAARWVTATTNPQYREAFRSYLTRPETAALDYTDKQNHAVSEASQVRAALAIGSGDTGGYLMPFELDPTVVVTNSGVTNPIRAVSRTVQTTTNVWHGVSSAGVTAEWLAEAAEAADASPTFAQPSVAAHRASAYVQASLEAAADTSIADQLQVLFADAKDRLEAAAFATGNGTTQPAGIVTRVSAVTASRVAATTNNTFGLPDVYKVKNALGPRHRPNSTWVAEQTTMSAIRQFDTTGSAAFWTNLGGADPEQLLGRPAYECSLMDGALATGDDDILLLGDFTNYVICDRIGATVLFDPIVKGANRRPTGEVGWFLYWRVGADCVNTDAFRLLRV